VRLADPGRAQEQHRLAVGDKTPGGELADLLLVERGLGAEVEAVEIAHNRKARQPQAHLDAPLVLARDLALDEEGQRLAQAQLALGRLVEQIVELIADRGQLETGEHPQKPLVIHHQLPPTRRSYSASGRSSVGSAAAETVDKVPPNASLAGYVATRQC
jgi:hypothetical protein